MSITHGFKPLWKPPFISRLAAEDRCHLNGLAMQDGAPAYVTAVSRSDMINGWRDRRHEGGVLIDVRDDRIVTDQLSMPHSPRVTPDGVYLLDSGRGMLARVDPEERRAGPTSPSAPASCAASPSTTAMRSPPSRCRATAPSPGSRCRTS